MITDPQIGPRDLQIVTVQIRPADPLRSAIVNARVVFNVVATSSCLLVSLVFRCYYASARDWLLGQINIH